MFQFCSLSLNSPLPVVGKHVSQPVVKGERALGTRMNMFQFPCVQDSTGEKAYCPDANCALTGKTLKPGTFAHYKTARNGVFSAKTLS